MLWLICLLLQEEPVQIRRAEKGPYDAALRKYREAELRLAKDPKGAIAYLEELFKQVPKHVECRLKIERDVGEWDNPIDFHPYQLRARARLALADSDKANAEKHLRDAIQDLEVSVQAKVKSSGELLKEANRKLDKLKPIDDPSKTFEAAWTKLIQERKYRSATRHLEEKGAFLEAPRRQKYLDEAATACREHVARAIEPFGAGVRLSLTKEDFQARYALPDESELIGTHPLLDWSKAQRSVLEMLVAKEEVSEPLLAQMLQARALAPAADNRWFRVSAELAHAVLERRLSELPNQQGTVEERRKAREEATRIVAQWSTAIGRLEPDWRDQYTVLRSGQLKLIADALPVDPAELDAIDLDACFKADSPETVLLREIEKLQEILKIRGLSQEAKRRGLTLLVAASAMKGLLEGRSVEQVIEDLRGLRGELKRAEGAVDPDRWGPKVARVLTAE